MCLFGLGGCWFFLCSGFWESRWCWFDSFGGRSRGGFYMKFLIGRFCFSSSSSCRCIIISRRSGFRIKFLIRRFCFSSSSGFSFGFVKVFNWWSSRGFFFGFVRFLFSGFKSDILKISILYYIRRVIEIKWVLFYI